MGEVYRARDPRLEREVALKVLPADTLHDPSARARLLREARLAATLNHPNICTVYDVGEADGHVFIAMELVEGRPLSEWIAARGGGLPTENVVRYGAQIAAALAHAHERHVIHRDLKSSNVVITTDGRVKVLDFGLARRVWEAPDGSGNTLSVGLTETGAIVGTPHYLAPEVLRGSRADERSDLWALGVLLHELASGALPFKGATSFELASAILNDLPATLPERLPAGLRSVIGRCLAKEPGERYARASEVRAALEALGSDSAVGTGLSPRTQASARRAPRARSNRVAVAAALAAALAVTALMVWRAQGPPQLNPAMRTRPLDIPMPAVGYAALSQDGHWIAMPARDDRGTWGLYYMNAGGGDVRPIAVDSSVAVNYSDLSPDGSQVVYSVMRSLVVFEIRVASTLGGRVRTLVDQHPDLIPALGGTPRWSPDGKWIGFIAAAPDSSAAVEFWKMRPDGSEAARVFTDRAATAGFPVGFAWSPDGKRVAWIRNFDHGAFEEIFVHDLVTGRERQLTHDRKHINELTWTAQDEVMFSSNRGGATNLWVMGAGGGEPLQVTRGAGPDLDVRVSADGRTLVYLVREPLTSIGWWNVATGKGGFTTREPEPYFSQQPSPDGRRLLVSVRDPDALAQEMSLVVMNRDGTDRRALVPASAAASWATWSPDGRRIAWLSDRDTRRDSIALHVMTVDTSEESLIRSVPIRGDVSSLRWMSGDTLVVQDGTASILYSLSHGAILRSPELTWLLTSQVPGWRVFFDRRGGPKTEGAYISPLNSWAGRLIHPKEWYVADPTNSSFLYCWPESLGFCRLDLPSGRLSRVARAPAEIRRDMFFYPTRDGRAIFWSQNHEASKLVRVEDLRK
jgi:Tol biopolymer transport system component/predicted Ser/Thr protein kinase